MLQALPLEVKVRKTELRIQEWVNEYGTDGVYVCFSGGKDSTVLLHIVRNLYPNIEAVFVNTGLEYPEIQQFVSVISHELQYTSSLKHSFISKGVSNIDNRVKDIIKAELNKQFDRGVNAGAYGIAGVIHDMIAEYSGEDYSELVKNIDAFLKPALGLKDKQE